MLSEQDFGKTRPVPAVWSTMEELLLGYDETPYVSAAYQASLEGAGARGDMLAGRDLPPELPEWVESLGQDNVRVAVGAADRRSAAHRGRTRNAPPTSPAT